jgi:hypothetical protein
MEIELEFAADGMDTGHVNCHVHPRCFAAWEAERSALAGQRSSPDTLAGRPRLNGTVGFALRQAPSHAALPLNDEGTLGAAERDSTTDEDHDCAADSV